MKFPLACLLSFSLAFSLSAQSNFQKGFIVTNQDTVHGYINVREWEKSPQEIDFKKTLDGPAQNFTVNQIQYFKAPGYCAYQRFFVSISMNEVSLGKTSISVRKPNVSDTVLMNILSDGKNIKLFLYRDQVKPRFYYKTPGQNVPEELYYDVYRDGGQMRVREGYKNQLAQCARSNQVLSKKLETRIKRAAYSEGYLKKIVDEINGGEDQNERKEAISVEKQSTGFFIGVGINRNMLTLDNGTGSNFSLNATKKSTYVPYFFAGYDIAIKPQTGRLFFRFDLAFSKATLKSTTEDNSMSYPLTVNYTFKQSNTSFGANLLYNFYSAPTVKIRAGAGLRANFSTYKKANYVFVTGYPGAPRVQESEPAMANFWLSIPIRLSCLLYKHYEIGAGYIPAVNLSEPSEPFHNNLSAFFLGVNYHF